MPRAKVDVVKVFTLGRKSLSVRLLSTGVVEKRYDPRKPHHADRFHHEVAVLRRLQGCAFVPTLISVDPDRLMIKQSYCGEKAPDTPQVRSAIDAALRHLDAKYGVVRRGNVGKPSDAPRRVPTLNNVTLLNGQIFIIDFGSSGWLLSDRKHPDKPIAHPCRRRTAQTPGPS